MGEGGSQVNAYIYNQNEHANTWNEQNIAIWNVLPTNKYRKAGKQGREISDCVTLDLHRTNEAQALPQHD
jgi:hypothetical protein